MFSKYIVTSPLTQLVVLPSKVLPANWTQGLSAEMRKGPTEGFLLWTEGLQGINLLPQEKGKKFTHPAKPTYMGKILHYRSSRLVGKAVLRVGWETLP